MITLETVMILQGLSQPYHSQQDQAAL